MDKLRRADNVHPIAQAGKRFHAALAKNSIQTRGDFRRAKRARYSALRLFIGRFPAGKRSSH
jgi:hypothetical protein